MKRMWILGLFASLLGAQSPNISGTWIAKAKSPFGELDIVYRLNVDQSGKITGSQELPFGESPIVAGQVTGNQFEFTVEMDFFGNVQKVKGSGKIAGDALVIEPAMPTIPPGLIPPDEGGRPPGEAGLPPSQAGPAPGAPGSGGPPGRLFSGPLVARRGTPAPSYRARVDFKTLPNLELPELKDVPYNGLAKTPPMGWNSWNKFQTRFDDKTVREIADALVGSGMKDAGYQFINIDDGWQDKRDANGVLQPNPNFPNMKALADYVHSKGLKLGLYSSPGPLTCAGYTGSYGHEEIDAKTWSAWGIDYLKYDWCSASRIWKETDMQPVYQRMGEALAKAERPIVFSLCQYGMAHVEKWGPKVGGNLWRTTGDIVDRWQSMTRIGFSQSELAPYAAPGHWNDPDMLEVGNGGMTTAEYRTHFTLWSMLAAPLIAGNDLRNMSADIKGILLNKEVISVDQDPLGKGGYRVSNEGETEVWAKPLEGGAWAVALFNRGAAPAKLSVKWSDLKLDGKLKVRDLWAHADKQATAGGYEAEVPAHDVMLLRVSR
jgi:alpha-galactosidase